MFDSQFSKLLTMTVQLSVTFSSLLVEYQYFITFNQVRSNFAYHFCTFYSRSTVTVGAPTVEGAKVVCEVVSHLVKGDKVLVFHKKRRKGYRKLNGHRQQFTELTIKQVIA